MAPLTLLHIDYMSIETTMELNKPPKIVNILVFQDHFMKHFMAYVTPIRPQRPLPSSCTKGTSKSSEPQPSSSVMREKTAWATLFRSCANSWELTRLRLHPTMLRPMGRWNAHTRLLCGWLENFVRFRRQTGPTTCQRWYKPTTLQDMLWLGIAHIT